MPEYDKERAAGSLTGETTSTSSDEAIRAILRDLAREYHGLRNTEKTDDAELFSATEQLPPRPIGSTFQQPIITEIKLPDSLREPSGELAGNQIAGIKAEQKVAYAEQDDRKRRKFRFPIGFLNVLLH